MVAADSVGNVVSMTATQGGLYGSTVVIDGLGMVMGHGMSRFDLAAGSPNAPAAGKRMLHNMAPALVLGHDGARAAVGLPGGRKIVTVTAQLVVSLLDFDATPDLAISAGRVHIEAGEPLAVSAVGARVGHRGFADAGAHGSARAGRGWAAGRDRRHGESRCGSIPIREKWR